MRRPLPRPGPAGPLLAALLPGLCLLPGQALAAPLGPARLAELHGQAFLLPARVRPRQPPPLKQGDVLAPGDGVATAAGGLLELTFADGSLVRLGPSTTIILIPGERRVDLLAGRALVHADPMIGGVELRTPTLACDPIGTTYLVETGAERRAEVLVLEGAVQVTRPRPPPPAEGLVLPGELLAVAPRGPLGRPSPRSLTEVLAREPLVTAFASPLPTLPRIRGLESEQRRGVLAERNARWRREIRWKRPRRKPIQLPELFQP